MAYTRVNWENLPSTDTPINAANLNIMDAGIKDLDTEMGNCMKYTTVNVSSLDDLKSWAINTARIGAYIVDVNQSGSRTAVIMQKASSSYLSFIRFSYGINATQYKYLNGTWTEVSL